MNTYDPILNPKKLLHTIGIAGNATVADFGCGPGIFSIPAAELTEGTVYCLDVLTSALEAIAGQVDAHNIGNIVTKRVNLEIVGGSGLADADVEYVIMRKILLQNAHKEILFQEAYRVLRAGGTLLIVGWTPAAVIGPEVSQRLSQEEVEQFAVAAGFSGGQKIATDAGHYAITFTKKA